MSDQVNIHDVMLSANTLSVKEEQCQEHSFIEDKVCISETAIIINNAELQDPIWHGKIKQDEEPTCLNYIKTELASFQVADIQNDIVKIEGGINADVTKIEFNNGQFYCEHCEAYYVDYCTECGMLVHILNKRALNNADSGACRDIPNDILEIQDCFGQTGIYALRIIPAGVKLGPFTGLSATECPWEMKGEKFVLDKNKSKYLNWIQYINPTKNISEQNLHVIQSEDNIYYQSTRKIEAGEELLVHFGEEYGNSPNKIVKENVTTTNDIINDVFACTFCCLGFSSRSHLAKHKSVCVEDAAGKFSTEELEQCPSCKINLDLKEYFEYHMSFCSERNARKCILSTPTPKQTSTALNERKSCLREIYKCKQCKYRTKYPADLKEHTNNQHYNVKRYKCGICNRPFKAKEFLRLHVKSTHAYVGGKDDHEDFTTDYRNTDIKVEQSSLRDQKKIFKCALCLFRAKYKQSLRIHIKTKHLKNFDYKCDSCEYGTNRKDSLEVHIKTKHLKEFDYNCDSCDFGTNSKHHLEGHIKTKHLKKFDYKCDSCKYRTNLKNNLDVHIKTKHLKKFSYKCDSCVYGTNIKRDFKNHIKSKHLKVFDHKCDSCEFGTNNKSNLEGHIKNKHLKQFSYKCDSCEYETNTKTDLKKHIKSKHLKEFDYKCDSCEYGTYRKDHLEGHIKTKHLKKFSFKCESCEFETNIKTDFKKHIKSKHLKEFDYKCGSCEFGTNSKYYLEVHIKTKHLKIFDYKCDSCEYETNNKSNSERHMKNKH